MFHDHCGDAVGLSDDKRTAELTGGSESFVVLSAQSLSPGEALRLRVEETLSGGLYALSLGVTGVDPDTRPHLPTWARQMEESSVVSGGGTRHKGKEAGPWGGHLWVSPGDTVGVLWEDNGDVFIIINDTTTRAFTRVSGPVWAVTEVDGFVHTMSILSPEPKPTESKKKPPVPRTPVSKKPVAVSLPPEPPKPTTREGTSRAKPSRTATPKPTGGDGLSGAMGGDGLSGAIGELRAQSLEASGGFMPSIPRGTSTIVCPYWELCNRFIDSLQLPAIYFDTQYDTCYCTDCIISRGDNLYYTRGVPPKQYGLPLGWCRFGLSAPVQAHGMEAFQRWHVAYHGTIPKNIKPIFESQNLLMPGDYTIEGVQLAPPPGHFTEARKPQGFDIKQVFVSPTISYAGHPVYARPQRWTDPQTELIHNIQVAIQVRIKPDAYEVGPETLGLRDTVLDAKFDNSELEWSTKIRGATIPQGILVKSLLG